MEADLSSQNVEVRKRLKKFSRRIGLSFAFGYLGFAGIGLGVISGSTPLSVRGVLILIGGSISFLSAFVATNLARDITSEERLFLRTYRVMSAITKFLMDTTHESQRDLAVKRLRTLTEKVEDQWTLDFELAQNSLPEVSEFKSNLRNNLLYTLENGTVEKLQYARQALNRVARFLLNPTPTREELAEINRFLVTLDRKPEKASRLPNFIRVSWQKTLGIPTFRRVVILTLTLLSGPILYAWAVSVGNAGSYALPAGVAASVGLTGIYVQFLKKS